MKNIAIMSNKKQLSRQTSLELLRIIAMFLVLMVHANFYTFGQPTGDDLRNFWLTTSTHILFEGVSIISVNVFIAISGWFLIKVSVKGLCKFCFQCLFFIVGIYFILVLGGIVSLDFAGIKHCLFLTSEMWFVQAYIGLYILSPVLNRFIETASKSQMERFIICFYIFQTVFSFNNAARFIVNGYSTFSFIGIYMLARFVRVYLKDMISVKISIALIFVPILVNVLLFSVSLLVEIEGIRDTFTYYSNPLVVLSAVACVLFFSKLKLPNINYINVIASSAFAVYLFHQESYYISKLYKSTIKTIYDGFNGPLCLVAIFGFLITVFAISILLDQPRKWLWRVLERKLFSRCEPEKQIESIATVAD